MQAQSITDIRGVPLLLVAAAITASATVANAIVTWIKDRNSAAKRIQALDEAKRIVDFWTALKAAQDPNATEEERVAFQTVFDAKLLTAKTIGETRGSLRPARPRLAWLSSPWHIITLITSMMLMLFTVRFISDLLTQNTQFHERLSEISNMVESIAVRLAMLLLVLQATWKLLSGIIQDWRNRSE
jgi:hypothetical protein